MTKIQLEKLGRIIDLARPPVKVNMSMYIHSTSRDEAREIIKRIPKNFRRTSKVTESGSDWTETIKRNVYGLGRLEVTVFYPKKKGGENIEDKSTV